MSTWFDRDNAIVGLTTRHVCACRHFFHLFTSKAAAYRRIKKLWKAGHIRFVGSVDLRKNGRPEYAFCNSYKPKVDQIHHELLLTDFFLCYPHADTVRGWIVNRRLRPDGEMTLDGYFYYVELDTGEQSYAQVRRRQAVYAGTTDFILYVTITPGRLKGLLSHVHKSIKDIALFTTLADVQRDPRGEIWIDSQGERTAI